MIRIIDGVAYEGKLGAGGKLKAHDLGNGHMELSAVRPTEWHELAWCAQALSAHEEMMAKYRDENAEEIRERSLTIAANRAKTRVRKLCKAMGADTLLTLTYRANEQDLARCKADLKEFVRRFRRILPDFQAVACFESQERGALHIHMATARVPSSFTMTNASGQRYKVKSFDAIRAVWRSVTKDRGGNIDLARRKAHSQRSPARIAAYIAKYIIKAFNEGVAYSNRWTKFGNFDVPAPVLLGHFKTMAEAIAQAYQLVHVDDVVVLQKLSHWKDWFFLTVERPKPLSSR